MNERVFGLGAIATLCVLAVGPVWSQTSGQDIQSQIQAAIDVARLDHGLQGLAVSILTPALGVRNFASGSAGPEHAVDTSDVFVFDGYPRLLTAIAVMQLVEEGRLGLGDRAAIYADGVDQDLALRTLLEYRPVESGGILGTLEIAVGDSTREISVGSQAPALNAPAPDVGTKHTPSPDPNAQILGRIIESLRDLTVQTVFQDWIFTPSGTGAIYVTPLGTQDETSESPELHSIDPSQAEFRDATVATATDMIRVLDALFSGALVSESSLAAIKTGGAPDADFGLGIMRKNVDGTLLYGHSGARVHDTRTFLDPESGIGISLALNQTSGATDALFSELFRIVRDATLGLDCYPNPAIGSMHVSVTMHRPSPVNISVLNDQGKIVSTLFDGVLPDGVHSLLWDTSSHPPGMYLVRARAGTRSATLLISSR